MPHSLGMRLLARKWMWRTEKGSRSPTRRSVPATGTTKPEASSFFKKDLAFVATTTRPALVRTRNIVDDPSSFTTGCSVTASMRRHTLEPPSVADIISTSSKSSL